ncbi:hypothetical protein BD769DRAFT_1636328 [Suillus cothurnatus]|nr:hypothetical protein BD769DRAFT_1636328 [Suillus cothurnatus]
MITHEYFHLVAAAFCCSIPPMKKLFGRDKPKQPSHRDVDDTWYDLQMMIGEVTATLLEEWTLVLAICKRACADEANAKVAVEALRREFRYGEPTAQLCAARLWAIILRNASDVFLAQTESRKFIDVLADVITSPKTSPVVRDRLMEVLAGAVFITGSRPSPLSAHDLSPFSLKDRDRDRDGLRALWSSLKPFDKPDVGIPFDTEDAMFSPAVTPTRPPVEEAISMQPPTVGIGQTTDQRVIRRIHFGESHRDYEGSSSPPLPHQHDMLTVVHLQPRPPPRALLTLSPTPSSYNRPPPYGSPREYDLPLVVPSPTHPLPRIPPAPFPAHSHHSPPPPYASTSTLLPVPFTQTSQLPICPPHPPTPSPPPDNTFLIGPSTRVLEEVDNKQHGSNDSKSESVVLDSDEEVHDGVHANMWWLQRTPTRATSAGEKKTSRHCELYPRHSGCCVQPRWSSYTSTSGRGDAC